MNHKNAVKDSTQTHYEISRLYYPLRSAPLPKEGRHIYIYMYHESYLVPKQPPATLKMNDATSEF